MKSMNFLKLTSEQTQQNLIEDLKNKEIYFDEFKTNKMTNTDIIKLLVQCRNIIYPNYNNVCHIIDIIINELKER